MVTAVSERVVGALVSLSGCLNCWGTLVWGFEEPVTLSYGGGAGGGLYDALRVGACACACMADSATACGRPHRVMLRREAGWGGGASLRVVGAGRGALW